MRSQGVEADKIVCCFGIFTEHNIYIPGDMPIHIFTIWFSSIRKVAHCGGFSPPKGNSVGSNGKFLVSASHSRGSYSINNERVFSWECAFWRIFSYWILDISVEFLDEGTIQLFGWQELKILHSPSWDFLGEISLVGKWMYNLSSFSVTKKYFSTSSGMQRKWSRSYKITREIHLFVIY